MNKETIETIIANLAEKGYNIERKEIKDKTIYVDYGDCMFYFEFGNAGVKYWISNLFTFVEGWIDAMAGLLNSHVSRNVGLKVKVPQKDNEYIFIKSAIGTILTIIFIYFCSKYLLWFLPESIYNEVLNPLIYIFALFEYLTKLRYYM